MRKVITAVIIALVCLAILFVMIAWVIDNEPRYYPENRGASSQADEIDTVLLQIENYKAEVEVIFR